MKWQRIKKHSDIKLGGVRVEIEEVDRSVKSVTLTDAAGNQMKVALDGYSMIAMVPAQPEMKDAWLLSGTYKGLQVREYHESEYAATSRRAELGHSDELTIEKIKVAVDDEGKTPEGDEIPF